MDNNNKEDMARVAIEMNALNELIEKRLEEMFGHEVPFMLLIPGRGNKTGFSTNYPVSPLAWSKFFLQVVEEMKEMSAFPEELEH